jgi:hypothetical protein
MKLKPKPQKPKRLKVSKKLRIFDEDPVQNILDFIKENDVSPSDCKFYVDYGYGETSDSYYVCFWKDESNEKYQKKYEKYRKDLREWYEWYNENKDEIKKEREKQKKIKELQKEYKERMIKIQKL